MGKLNNRITQKIFSDALSSRHVGLGLSQLATATLVRCPNHNLIYYGMIFKLNHKFYLKGGLSDLCHLYHSVIATKRTHFAYIETHFNWSEL